ncbi:immunoglobulin domain-containing protein [Haloferula sargassicola]|uniref:Ig-like domain-containing protein n=1 Tax=Haloferula sargassicola TaxID=490096 RepID=A0ABP9UQY3_9BACT
MKFIHLVVPGMLAGLTVHADSVSWNLDNNSTVGGEGAGALPLSPSLAGATPVDHWTNSWPSNITTNLRDDSGNATTVDIAYSSNGGTFAIDPAHPGQDSDGTWNKEMLNGYLNAGGGGTSSLTFSQVPYTSYDICVYFSADVADREGSVSDGTTTYYFRTIGQPTTDGANAVLIQTTDTVDDASDDQGNYAIFTGLSGATQTITVDIPSYGGIAGIQILNGSLPTAIEFVGQPEDQSVAIDGDATFSVAAVGDPAPTYQWEYSPDDGVSGWTELAGETFDTLEIFGVGFGDVGYYRVVATNDGGPATSDSAYLDAYYAEPEFFLQPMDVYAEIGSTVELAADAYTYGNASYQWFKDTAPLPGETGPTLTLDNVSAADDGDYYLEVTDDIEANLVGYSDIAIVRTFVPWDGLVSEEPFDMTAGYTAGELPLQNPIVAGYADGWQDVDFGDAEPEVMSGSLIYADPYYLGSTGDRVGKTADAEGIVGTNSGRTYRLLEPRLVVADTTTGVRYLSWLYRNGNENAAAAPTVYSTLALYNGDTADANRSFEGGAADDAFGASQFFRVSNVSPNDLGVPVDGNVHLFVAKFDLSADDFSDTVTVWIDPTLGSGEPPGGMSVEFANVRFDRLALSDYASNSAAWDEIRWGATFDSVTLNPNPPENTYASWISLYPGVGAMTGFHDDPDGDGLDNGLENFFGTDPGAANAGVVNVSKSGNTLSFQHPRNATPAADISARYRWSLDLANWNASGATAGGVTVGFAASADTPETGITSVTATLSGATPERLFTDIQVTQGAP